MQFYLKDRHVTSIKCKIANINRSENCTTQLKKVMITWSIMKETKLTNLNIQWLKLNKEPQVQKYTTIKTRVMQGFSECDWFHLPKSFTLILKEKRLNIYNEHTKLWSETHKSSVKSTNAWVKSNQREELLSNGLRFTTNYLPLSVHFHLQINRNFYSLLLF